MTEKTLQELLRKYRVPFHIQAHMKKVAAVSLFIGTQLQDSGQKVDLTILRQAALLHDILKLCDFKELNLQYFQKSPSKKDKAFWTELIKSCSHKGHIQAAYELFMDIGEPQIASIIKKHRFNCLIEKNEKPTTWEEKILYYADKRVKHDQVVSIQERLEDGRKRYFPDGHIPKEDAQIEKALYKLEQELCNHAKIHPEEINEKNVSQSRN